jgi:hypothetical protein
MITERIIEYNRMTRRHSNASIACLQASLQNAAPLSNSIGCWRNAAVLPWRQRGLLITKRRRWEVHDVDVYRQRGIVWHWRRRIFVRQWWRLLWQGRLQHTCRNKGIHLQLHTHPKPFVENTSW